MQRMSAEHDIRADFNERALRTTEGAMLFAIVSALRRLEEISSMEVISGDDYRLDEAKYVLRLARNRFNP